MYGGHYPRLDVHTGQSRPPVRFRDREGRPIDLRVYGEGPVDDERAALRRLYREFDPADRTLGVPPATLERIDEWLDAILADDCVLAWHGDRAVGQAVLVADPNNGPETYEFAIFVASDYQGAGIGTRLTEATLLVGREGGARNVWLLVEGDNRAAVTLYREVGFVPVDRSGSDVEMKLVMS